MKLSWLYVKLHNHSLKHNMNIKAKYYCMKKCLIRFVLSWVFDKFDFLLISKIKDLSIKHFFILSTKYFVDTQSHTAIPLKNAMFNVNHNILEWFYEKNKDVHFLDYIYILYLWSLLFILLVRIWKLHKK